MQRSKAPIKIYSNTPIKNGSKDQDEFLHDMQMLQDPTDALFAAEEAFLREHDGVVDETELHLYLKPFARQVRVQMFNSYIQRLEMKISDLQHIRDTMDIAEEMRKFEQSYDKKRSYYTN